MATKIFVNLPVKDLSRTMSFFKALGFSFNEQFTDEKAACMVLSEDGYVMLLTEAFFKGFTKKEIADTGKTTEVINALSVESKAAVDEMYDKAIAAGGSPSMDAQDMGFMYQRSFQDPDGHQWEIFWMDPSAIQ